MRLLYCLGLLYKDHTGLRCNLHNDEYKQGLKWQYANVVCFGTMLELYFIHYCASYSLAFIYEIKAIQEYHLSNMGLTIHAQYYSHTNMYIIYTTIFFKYNYFFFYKLWVGGFETISP